MTPNNDTLTFLEVIRDKKSTLFDLGEGKLSLTRFKGNYIHEVYTIFTKSFLLVSKGKQCEHIIPINGFEDEVKKLLVRKRLENL